MYDKTVKLRKKILTGEIFKKFIPALVCFISSTVILPGSFSPFGVSSLIAFSENNSAVIFALTAMLGYLCVDFKQSIPDIVFCMIIGALSVKKNLFIKQKHWKYFCLSFFVLCNLLYIVFEGFTLYEVMKVILEVFAIYILYDCYSVFFKHFASRGFGKKIMKNEISAFVAIGLVIISAFSNVYLPFELNLSSIICIFVMLFIAYKFTISSSAVAGIVLGLANSVSNINMLYCVASFSVAGFFSSFAKRYGKTGVILSFILTNALFTYIVNGSTEVLISLYEIILAAVILYVIPENKLDDLKYSITNIMKDEENEAQRMNIVKSFTNKRLKKLSNAFDSISTILLDDKKRKNVNLEQNIDSMIETVSERVCRKCKGSKRCWKNNYSETYSVIKNLFYASEKRGWAEQYDIQSSFRDICFNCSQLVVESNKVYELYRMNKIWESRADESKILISQQFGSMSRVTSNLAEELSGQYSFRRDMETALLEELAQEGIKVLSVTVVRINSRHLKVKLSLKNDNKILNHLIISACQKVLGKRMKIEEISTSSGITKYDLSEQELFSVDTGISRIRPDKDSVSGDSYSIMRPDGEKIIVALSDGMGTGAAAAKESTDTVNLLEKLLSAGIEKNVAIRLVNSVLILKSFDESFATIDMLVFDLYTGEGEFIKTGGVSSYILRKNAVTEICAGSLPAGIVSDAQSCSYKTEFKDGDVVIILSDGITDISHDDEWIKETLKMCNGMNAKEIADTVMENACKRTEECKDDMTAIAVKINLK